MALARTKPKKIKPLLKTNCLSHGTVECHDLARARRFYEEVLGFEVDDRAAVDEAHKIVSGVRQEYGIKKIQRPVFQHGTYSFYIVDADDNWWEILENPKGGYNYVFDLKETAADWREQNQGRDRISKGKRQMTQRKKKKVA